MRRTIICIGSVGSYAYTFPETGTEVSSYEELCYYLKEHMLFYVDSLPEEGLIEYIISELNLPHLGSQLKEPEIDQIKYFTAIFREGNYYTEEEIQIILDDYNRIREAESLVRYKCTGDLYLNYARYAMAIKCYDKAIEESKDGESALAFIYHNRGTAKARMFRFSEAKVDFLRAYQYGGNEESLFAYYALVAFEKGTGQAAVEISDFDSAKKYTENFELRFADIAESYKYTGEAAEFKRVDFLMENGRSDQAEILKMKHIRERQKQVRKSFTVDRDLEGVLPAIYISDR